MWVWVSERTSCVLHNYASLFFLLLFSLICVCEMVYLKIFAFYTSCNVYPQTENRQANKWQAYARHLFALFALSKSAAVCILACFIILLQTNWNEHFNSLFATQFTIPSDMKRDICVTTQWQGGNEIEIRIPTNIFREQYFEKVSLFLRLKLFLTTQFIFAFPKNA